MMSARHHAMYGLNRSAKYGARSWGRQHHKADGVEETFTRKRYHPEHMVN